VTTGAGPLDMRAILSRIDRDLMRAARPLIPPFENQSRAFFLDRSVAHSVALRVQVMRKDVNLARPRRIEARTERIARRWWRHILLAANPSFQDPPTVLPIRRLPDQSRQVRVRPHPIDPPVTVTQFSEIAINLAGPFFVRCHLKISAMPFCSGSSISISSISLSFQPLPLRQKSRDRHGATMIFVAARTSAR
jgi:hypothetical protein